MLGWAGLLFLGLIPRTFQGWVVARVSNTMASMNSDGFTGEHALSLRAQVFMPQSLNDAQEDPTKDTAQLSLNFALLFCSSTFLAVLCGVSISKTGN